MTGLQTVINSDERQGLDTSRHPEVEIGLVLNDRFVHLVEEGYEAAFRIGPLPNSGLMAYPLPPFTLVACASPGYLRERGIPAAPSDLRDHECVGHAHWSEASTTEWRFVKDGQAFTSASATTCG